MPNKECELQYWTFANRNSTFKKITKRILNIEQGIPNVNFNIGHSLIKIRHSKNR